MTRPLCLRHPLGALLVVLLLSIHTGCDTADPITPPSGSATYLGTLVGAGTSGALEVEVDGVSASGQVLLVSQAGRSGPPPLSGSYTPETGAIHLEGGGYTFDGTIVNGVLSGTWTGPNGTSGTFTALLGGPGTVVDVYCGTYDTQNDDGTFNLVRHDADLRGFAVSNAGGAIDLSGSVQGQTVTIWATETGPGGNVASGTLSADGASFTGTVNDPENPGTVSAARCTP